MPSAVALSYVHGGWSGVQNLQKKVHDKAAYWPSIDHSMHQVQAKKLGIQGAARRLEDLSRAAAQRGVEAEEHKRGLMG